MRRTSLRTACLVIGVLAAGPCGSALAQPPFESPPPLPGQHGQPKVYMPTITPLAGGAPTQPNYPSPQPAPPWPQYPPPANGAAQAQPPRPGMIPQPPWPGPTGSVVPASASSPAPAPRPVLPAAQPAGQAGGYPAAGANIPTSQAPSVFIEKRGPEVVNVGQPLTYEILVRNTGQVPVYHVRVEDELPGGVRYLGGEPTAELGANRLIWNLPMLEPGTERRLRVGVQPPGEGELRTCATVTFSVAACLRTQVTQPRLVLATRGPDQTYVGEPVPFQILVSNPGSGPATNLLLRGKLPEGLQHPQGQVVEAELGTLAPGESRSVTLTATAAKAGRHLSEITASADGGLEATSRAAVQVLGAELQARRGGPQRCLLKGEVNWEVEVSNTGSAPATNVELSDTIPAGLEFVSAGDGGLYDASGRTVTWRFPSLAPGGRQKVTFRVKAVSVGEHVDHVSVRAERGVEAKAEAPFTVEGVPALMLEVVDLEDPIEVGGELTYEVRVVNQGSCPCTNIQITATVPDGLQARDGTGPTAYRFQGAQIVFEPLAKLATKADVVYRMKVRGLQPGDYRFKVQMTCDQLRQPVYKEESSRVYKDVP